MRNLRWEKCKGFNRVARLDSFHDSYGSIEPTGLHFYYYCYCYVWILRVDKTPPPSPFLKVMLEWLNGGRE